MNGAGDSGIDIYWLPVGAGGRSVRLNGRAFEWLAAKRADRPPLDLYRAALEVHLDGFATRSRQWFWPRRARSLAP
jgi:hypothetical protein